MLHIYKKEELIRQLEQLHTPKGAIVLMHSSLRSIGKVEGGAEGLLDILIDHFAWDGGLFCVPTHTWHNLGKDITLDMDSDESCLSAFAGVAIRDGRGIRSENPCHSMVVFGERERAEAFVEGELFVSTPTAPESCYGKLIENGGFVLLVGVGHNKNTCLHTVDEMLHIPNRMGDTPVPMAVKKGDQLIKRELRLFQTDYIEDISLRFWKYETAFRYHRCITDGFLGNAPVQLCDAKKMKETVALIYQNSNRTDPLKDEEAIPPKWYI